MDFYARGHGPRWLLSRTLRLPVPAPRFGGYRPGLVVASAFATGVQLSIFLASAPLSVGMAVLSLAALAKRLDCGRDPVRLGFWASLFLALGLLRGAAPAPDTGAPVSAPTAPHVTFRGVVVSVPVHLPAGEERNAGSLSPGPGRALFDIRAPSGPRRLRVLVAGARRRDLEDLQGGSVVDVSGRLLAGRGPRNPGERRGSGPLLWAPSPRAVKVIGVAPLGVLEGRLVRTRKTVHDIVAAYYDREQRGLMLSLLLGDRRLLSPGWRRSLTTTGTFHFIAISGLHVGILMLLVTRLPFPRGMRTAGRLLCLGGFALLTGGSASVVRAALMLSLHLLARRLGRRPHPLNTLGWTAFTLLAARPAWLWDLGFQLSFVAVGSLLSWEKRILAPDVDLDRFRPRHLRWSARRRLPLFTLVAWATRVLRASLATTAGTAPLVLLYFHRFHPLGPLWTLAAYPLAVLTLATGGLSVLVGLVSLEGGEVLALPARATMEALAAVLDFGATVPGSCVYLPPPAHWRVVVVYVMVVAGLSDRLRGVCLGLGGLLLLAAVLAPAGLPTRPTLLTFDVGAGSAALLTVPEGGSYLIDAGGRGPYAGDRLVRYLLSTGHRRLSGVILTHADDDHVGGLERLVECLDVKRVWVSRHFERFAKGRATLERVRRRGVPVRTLKRGDRLLLPGSKSSRLSVLYPAAQETLSLGRSANETSLCVLLDVEGGRVLSLGDLEQAGLTRLFSGGDSLDAAILVLPHHGRWNPRYPELLARVSPRTVVVSGNGAGGARELAHLLEDQGFEVFTTWGGGAVVSEWDGSTWSTRYWRGTATEPE